jgi:hypothetical protein
MKELIDQYSLGAGKLREAVSGMTTEQLRARPVPGKWSTHEVVCHLADAEMLYADRIKRVLAEDKPKLASMDPDLHVTRLSLVERDVQNELALVDAVRRQMTSILRTLSEADFERVGMHSEAGPLTLRTLLERVTNHIPHHLPFIAEKRAALAGKP